MAKQINNYIIGISKRNHTAYTVFRSVEMTLPKIQNYIDTSMDYGTAIRIVVLDFTEVFKIIDHCL